MTIAALVGWLMACLSAGPLLLAVLMLVTLRGGVAGDE